MAITRKTSTSSKLKQQQKLDELLQHAANGRLTEVDAILTEFPDLALLSGSVRDQAQRELEGTVLKIAAGAVDIGLQPGETGMMELICNHMAKLQGGVAEIAKQLREQFPDGWRAAEAQREASDFAALDKVVNAIKHSKSEQACQADILEFLNYLTPKGICKTGLQFNPTILGKACRLYDENYKSFGGKGSYKNKLMWSVIIGSIEMLATTCYANALLQGLFNIIRNNQALKRELLAKDSEAKESFFLYKGDQDSKLGKDFAIAADGDKIGMIWNNDFCLLMLNASLVFQPSSPFIRETHFYFEEYNKKKDEALEAFIQNAFAAALRPNPG